MKSIQKLRRVFRTLKTGELWIDSSYYNTYHLETVGDKYFIKTKIKYYYNSKNGNNINWFIEQKLKK